MQALSLPGHGVEGYNVRESCFACKVGENKDDSGKNGKKTKEEKSKIMALGNAGGIKFF